MTEKEMLELAAKAAGLTLKWNAEGDAFARRDYQGKYWGYWNPIKDDGDALRLAVRCGIALEYRREIHACFAYHCSLNLHTTQKNDQLDPYAATRRAIVRLAAEIGKGMK